ncbi:type I-D CRISPR-associated protein Cas10d/Csc3 [Chrysosporum ovalisporum APH033B]|uniref:type I-D CRISPR-associated protein Cas10d/Csc3 n=1 Tax=Umezakia ovalisporum TaxID=75695 RepID=UPI002476DDF1|nr:type I-D CRISPR-associated protein Cas10d/Csc3 [Umezakia ovalisporum]MDH6067578.1 type I-D CRISPR-associated protein Cas10d/Csc3 [Umezakia ovalisporum APH033B]MDH6103244.1 type I-D CRISPR-associated protein Cas10d/Csc3 [Umezakia ovalisporum ANA283AFssAo]
MSTLLQTLIIETISQDTDTILRLYIEKLLPSLEKEFSLISALGGPYETHYQILSQLGEKYPHEKALKYSNHADQNLLVHVLNGLLIAWNISKYLPQPLSEIEKYLLCLAFTLHDYNKHCNGQGEETPKNYEVAEIIHLCRDLGEKLKFDLFWSQWREYLPEIAYLAQNAQNKVGTNIYPANWPVMKIKDRRRLEVPLRRLITFGDIAVHFTDPGDIDNHSRGDRLREQLKYLNINKNLVYHRLRDTIGILSNGIHNATMVFTKKLNYEPILFFAQGVIYLAPADIEPPDIEKLKEFIWTQISGTLGNKIMVGDIGFKRDGKGLKVAPQTLELFSPIELIPQLPKVIDVKVANIKDPATPKRLEKLNLTQSQREFLKPGEDIRADKIAEFIFFIQKEFFGNSPEYINWILNKLNLQDKISPEQTQIQAGGVNYGWYHAAAYYVATHGTFKPEDILQHMETWAEDLTNWASENNLLTSHHSPIRDIFFEYINQYLEIKGLPTNQPSFNAEFTAYIHAKTKTAKQPICSLSSGEFPSEDQMDSVVLFKPQQYSNKNPLGGRQIKRGISKIYALEMLLRQAFWAVPPGKLEEQQPIFLYIFPAYVYSPQTAAAIKLLINNMKQINLSDVQKQWLEQEMNITALQCVKWLHDEAELGRFSNDKYNKEDLPFMAMTYTTTKGKTITDAWVQPAFLALSLPILLGVKVIATASSVPIYSSDNDFKESTVLDAPAPFWNLLGLSNSLRIQDFENATQRLLIAYSLHLETRSSPTDAKWRDLIKTIREVTTNVLNIFALAQERLRRDKRDHPTPDEVKRYWQYSQLWVKQEQSNTNQGVYLMILEKLVKQYRVFYKPNLGESSHTILLPLSKALEMILSVPQQVEIHDLIFQTSGQIRDALERQEVYKRPIIMDKSMDISAREEKELMAIHEFITTCVCELFIDLYKGDRALLQENRNRIKSGAEFAYHWLAIQEKNTKSS